MEGVRRFGAIYGSTLVLQTSWQQFTHPEQFHGFDYPASGVERCVQQCGSGGQIRIVQRPAAATFRPADCPPCVDEVALAREAGFFYVEISAYHVRQLPEAKALRVLFRAKRSVYVYKNPDTPPAA